MTERQAHYTVLARRFRPQTFEEVVGQDRIGKALRNAIAAGRVAHAYLFTGARGVGKTSTARIFAKALNCPHVQDAIPCNNCEVCQSIAAGSDVDVLEIDGASNRGIDDIRSLRANVTIRSMRSPFKVYIIDEVHMLTKEAFNALLKTLEEPPPNVKFVFCTTEPNKVPDTILSRCQRFDFGTIASTGIMARLRQIAEAEKVQVDDAALELLARRAAGSMRDSQSLFDQLLAFGSDQITAEDVHQLLGTAGEDRLIGLMDAVIERRRNDALTILDATLEEGGQLGSLSDQLLLYLRDLLIIAAGAETVPLESVSESQRNTLSEQASRWGLRTITAALEVLSTTKSRMQRVNYDRALMELAIVRLSLLEDLDNIASLIANRQSESGGNAAAPDRANLNSTGVVPTSSEAMNPSAPETISVPTAARTTALQQPESNPRVPREPETSSASPQQTSPTIPLTPENLAVFWLEVVSRLPDRLQGHLRNADSPAISGPNRLDLLFPQSYVLSRQFCERPETRSRIAECATQVAGQPVEVTISQTHEPENLAAGKSPQSKHQSIGRRKQPDLSGDPFVQQALDVFGGTLIDVREISPPAIEGP